MLTDCARVLRGDIKCIARRRVRVFTGVPAIAISALNGGATQSAKSFYARFSTIQFQRKQLRVLGLINKQLFNPVWLYKSSLNVFNGTSKHMLINMWVQSANKSADLIYVQEGSWKQTRKI